MAANLQDFLDQLESAGELQRIAVPVSPMLEISAIADRMSKLPGANSSRSAKQFDPMHHDFGGKALLFESVEGCEFPLAINTFGSYRRMEMALGVEDKGGFKAIADQLASLTKPQPPRSLREAMSKLKEFAPLLKVPPKRKKRGICQDVVRLTSRNEVDLTTLPIIKCWPLDGDPSKVGYDITPEESGTAKGDGRYITLAGIHTIHADDRDEVKPASHNIGMYRAQLIDETHLAMHWHVHHDGASHWRSWKRLGQPMPIAIALGGEAVLPYAATAPLPPGISELLMAGFLNGKGIPLVRCKTVPLWVPVNSEIVIEGWVSTECGEIGFEVPPRSESAERSDDQPTQVHETNQTDALTTRNVVVPELGPGAVFEGPFGDHTGFYSLPDRYPIVEVSAITHRRNAVYPTTIVGLPPQEDYALGKATERIFLPLLQTLIHDIVDYHLPMFGCFHNCAFVQIKKEYALQARRVMHAIWGAGQMAWTKMIVVVDADVNVHHEEHVLHAMFKHCNFARDVELVNGPLDILDHAAPRLGAGHKIGFDATRKIVGEEVNGMPVQNDDFARWNKFGLQSNFITIEIPAFSNGRCMFIAVDKQRPGDGQRAIATVADALQDRFSGMLIAVDASVDITNWQEVFFHLCANADPGRDMVPLGDLPPGDARFGSIIGFDATFKTEDSTDERLGQPVRKYPPILKMDDAILQKVDARWEEYGLPPLAAKRNQ